MQHFYGIIPNERNPETGEEKYMVVWGTVFEDSSMCYVPASPIFEKNIHFALNDTLDHCIQESKKASDGKYEIRLYKRVSNDPKSDDYYSFTIDKKI